MPACPNCGQDNPDIAQLCMICGTPLRVYSTAPQDARKTVTIVFCDLVGSTALGERLDSESLREVMDRYFTEMREVLERHGGIVEKYIGDAIMAVFGLPRVHEDDALRAVRAASEMGRTLSRLNIELERLWGVSLSNRTGINTGEVVVGDAASGQRLATGDAVNVAARLEQKAPVGQVLIGPLTHRLVKDAVIVEVVEPLVLKGKAEFMPAFRIIGVSHDSLGVTRRLDAPMVGREGELKALLTAFDCSVAERRCHLVTVLGEAGVGKSRLVAEIVHLLGPKSRVLRGRCLSYGQGITFWPLAEVVKEAAEIADTDSPASARSKIASLTSGEEEADAISERLASVVGLSSTSFPLEETFWASRKALQGLAKERPLVVVLEDIHWAEATFLDLIEHVVAKGEGSPMLIVCPARRELLEERPEWMKGEATATTLSLEPLSEDDSELLVDNLLGASGLDAGARARIAGSAEGNPLFVEQIISMWMEDGTLCHEDGRWRFSADASTISIPPTISALLAARLDRLRQEERAVVAAASVVGQVFYRGAVEELSAPNPASQVSASLATLTSKQFILPAASTFVDEESYSFRHVLIRGAAYEAMLKRARAGLHERFASWLERITGERVAEYEEILGYHLEQAFLHQQSLGRLDDHIEKLGKRAAVYLASAGKRALSRGDMPSAVNLLERSVILLPRGDPQLAVLLPDLAWALTETGEFVRAESVVSDALDEAERCSHESAAAYARLERIRLRFFSQPEGVYTEALRVTEHSITLFERLGDGRGLARSWNLAAHGHWDLGKFTAAENAWWRAIQHAEAVGDRRERAEALSWLALATRFGPTPAPKGIEVCDLILDRAENDRKVQAFVFDARCVLEAMLGKFDQARVTGSRAAVLYDDLGLKVMGANLVQNSGFVEMLAGDPVAAESIYRSGYELLDKMGERGFLSTVAALLADALYEQMRFDEAERFTHVSEETAALDDVNSQGTWRSVRAKTLAQRGELEEAENLAREAVRLVDGTECLDLRADFRLCLAHVLRMGNRTKQAVQVVEDARRLYEQKGNPVSAAKACELIGELRRLEC